LLFEIMPDKVKNTFERTMLSLNIAHKANLLNVDFKGNQIATNKAIPFKKYSPSAIDIGDLIRTARKLGGWFSKLSKIEFLMYLNVQF